MACGAIATPCATGLQIGIEAQQITERRNAIVDDDKAPLVVAAADPPDQRRFSRQRDDAIVQR